MFIPSTKLFLVDTSALIRLMRTGAARLGWDETVVNGRVGICPPTELELLVSARSMSDRETILRHVREMYTWVPMPDQAFKRAGQMQEMLTRKGQHRSAGPIDLLVAAAAEITGRTLLHYDRDFETIAMATGQPTQWLAPPGSVD